MAFSNKKRATLVFILLMSLFLLVELFNIISESRSSDLDKFTFIGAVYNLNSNNPSTLEKFYKSYFNFYSLNSIDTNIIRLGNDAVRLRLVRSSINERQQIFIRTEKISRLFRKLIKMKIKFRTPMHLNENKDLTFSLYDPDSNLITFIGS